MPITVARALRHIVEHEKRLAANRRCARWPRYIFHTTHVSNAVEIVRTGSVGARSNTAGFHDVANQGALSAFDGSHDFARFYFRPKNGFHLRTEGIKCIGDPYRFDHQMSVPICFVFRLQDVLTRSDCFFSSGNLQRLKRFETGDAAFDALDFEAIYHDAQPDPSELDYIHDRRMAEVAVRDRLALIDGLQAIVFRTKWDMETFRWLLAARGVTCDHRLGIEHIGQSIFISQGLFVSDLDFRDDRLQMSFHFPLRNAPAGNCYRVRVNQDHAGGRSVFDRTIELVHPTLSIAKFSPDPQSVWTIELEEQPAFVGRLQHARSQVFG